MRKYASGEVGDSLRRCRNCHQKLPLKLTSARFMLLSFLGRCPAEAATTAGSCERQLLSLMKVLVMPCKPPVPDSQSAARIISQDGIVNVVEFAAAAETASALTAVLLTAVT